MFPFSQIREGWLTARAVWRMSTEFFKRWFLPIPSVEGDEEDEGNYWGDEGRATGSGEGARAEAEHGGAIEPVTQAAAEGSRVEEVPPPVAPVPFRLSAPEGAEARMARGASATEGMGTQEEARVKTEGEGPATPSEGCPFEP